MITKQHSFGSFVIVSVLGVLVDVSGGMTSIQLIPQNPVIGGSVTLSVTGITGRIQSIVWSKGRNTNREYQILTYIPGNNPIIPGPLYNSRMTHLPDGSLQISNLNMTDEGKYIVKIQTDKLNDLSVYMKIYDVVGKPSITISTSLSKENDTVTLTCTSTNAEWIVWSRVPDGATLSLDNRTLSFKIKRSDSGDYRCETSNPVSKKTSDPITITVALCETAGSSGNELDGGKIAGIVIGTVIGILILEVIVYFVIKKKKGKPNSTVYENVNVSLQHNNEMTLPGSGVNPTRESNYAQLSHKNRTIYSTIKPPTRK